MAVPHPQPADDEQHAGVLQQERNGDGQVVDRVEVAQLGDCDSDDAVARDRAERATDRRAVAPHLQQGG